MHKTPNASSPARRLPLIAGADAATDVNPDVLKNLRARHDALLTEVQPLLNERRSIRSEFEKRLTAEDEAQRPSEDDMNRFAADEETFGERITGRLEELRRLGREIEQEEALQYSLLLAQRASRHEAASDGLEFNGDVRITYQPPTYRKDNQGQFSYFLDLAAHQNQEVRGIPNQKLEGYQERMQSHAREMADIIPKRWQARERDAERRVEQAEREVRGRVGVRGELEESPFTRQARLESLRHTREAIRQGNEMEARAPSRIVGQGGYGVPPLS